MSDPSILGELNVFGACLPLAIGAKASWSGLNKVQKRLLSALMILSAVVQGEWISVASGAKTLPVGLAYIAFHCLLMYLGFRIFRMDDGGKSKRSSSATVSSPSRGSAR